MGVSSLPSCHVFKKHTRIDSMVMYRCVAILFLIVTLFVSFSSTSEMYLGSNPSFHKDRHSSLNIISSTPIFAKSNDFTRLSLVDTNNQTIPTNATIVDNGVSDTSVDFASDMIAMIFSILSALGSLLVFVMFYFEHVSIFGEGSNHSSRNPMRRSIREAIMDFKRETLNEQEHTLKNQSGFQKSRQVINLQKRKFIRRVILSLMVSDFIFSVSRALHVLWWWFCTYGVPDAMFTKTYLQQNGTSPSQSNLYQFTSTMEIMENITSVPVYYVAQYSFNYFPKLVQRMFAHINYASSLSTALWCVFVAIAIFTTTRRVKWIEDDKSVADSTDNLIDSYSSEAGNSARLSINNTSNLSSTTLGQLVTVDLNDNTTIKVNALHGETLPEKPQKKWKITRVQCYELSFHFVAWGLAFIFFWVLFLFRAISGAINSSPQDVTGFLTAVYIFWSLFFTGVSLTSTFSNVG